METAAAPQPQPTLILHLNDRQGVSWTEDTVDNEHLGRRSSKRCCIFHKVKKFAESDSDESDEDVEKAKKEPPVPGKPKNYQRHHA
jgi:protein phosphatase 1 regulatory subunit 11